MIKKYILTLFLCALAINSSQVLGKKIVSFNYINGTEVNLRNSPDKSGKVIDVLPWGTKVQRQQDNNSKYNKITVEGSKIVGYVAKKFLSISPPKNSSPPSPAPLRAPKANIGDFQLRQVCECIQNQGHGYMHVQKHINKYGKQASNHCITSVAQDHNFCISLRPTNDNFHSLNEKSLTNESNFFQYTAFALWLFAPESSYGQSMSKKMQAITKIYKPRHSPPKTINNKDFYIMPRVNGSSFTKIKNWSVPKRVELSQNAIIDDVVFGSKVYLMGNISGLKTTFDKYNDGFLPIKELFDVAIFNHCDQKFDVFKRIKLNLNMSTLKIETNLPKKIIKKLNTCCAKQSTCRCNTTNALCPHNKRLTAIISTPESGISNVLKNKKFKINQPDISKWLKKLRKNKTFDPWVDLLFASESVYLDESKKLKIIFQRRVIGDCAVDVSRSLAIFSSEFGWSYLHDNYSDDDTCGT